MVMSTWKNRATWIIHYSKTRVGMFRQLFVSAGHLDGSSFVISLGNHIISSAIWNK